MILAICATLGRKGGVERKQRDRIDSKRKTYKHPKLMGFKTSKEAEKEEQKKV